MEGDASCFVNNDHPLAVVVVDSATSGLVVMSRLCILSQTKDPDRELKNNGKSSCNVTKVESMYNRLAGRWRFLFHGF